MAELTPMMQQYREIKSRNPDCLLFFRLGDFYEMFDEDARLASRELDLTLTTRDRGKDKEEQTPMCGVPYHSSDSYIARLVAKGYKVAICEQMEDPALAKGLVKRDIVRIVTPGTVTESTMLEESRNNYYACICRSGESWGVCFCDISTGAFYATSARGTDAEEAVCNELGSFSPVEVLLGGGADDGEMLKGVLQERLHCCVNHGESVFEYEACERLVCEQFGKSIAQLGLESEPEVVSAAGALLATLRDAQKNALPHIRELEFYLAGRFMGLGLAARRNLELTETMRSKEKKGSLLWVLDRTATAMGGRLLRSWMERPLLSPALIGKRLSAVDELVKKNIDREELILALKDVTDLERVITRIVTGTANCRDMVALCRGTERLPEIRQRLSAMDAAMLRELCEQLDTLDDLRELVARAIVDDPPFTVREGKMIRTGYSEEVVSWCVENNVAITPGCVTPTEIMAAMSHGLKVVKFFPANVYGGLSAMKALSGPFGGIKFIPTGGVNDKNLAEYISAPFIHAVGGSWLCAKADIAAHNFDKITSLCKEARKTALGFEIAHVGVNAGDAEESLAVCRALDAAFGFGVKEGNSSNFAGSGVEVMKSPYLGKNGHIAVKTNSIPRAAAELAKNGFTLDESTAKYKGEKMVAVYLKQEFGGFAVHLLQK